MAMKVYVVMSNDYPDAVFANEREADTYVREKMSDPKNRLSHSMHTRIYYRSYEFELRQ
jgi:hypothetical protein